MRHILESVFLHTPEGAGLTRIICRRILESGKTVDKAIESDDALLACEGHKLDLLLLARLETYSRRGGNVEMIPESGLAVELKVSVYLEEMEMRANLYGTVAGIAHLEADGASAYIILDVAVGQDNAGVSG